MEEIRACFGIHIEACHNKRSGRQFTPLPCAEEMIPPALVAQQAAIAAAMSYVFIVGCFHDSKLIAISRGNAGNFTLSTVGLNGNCVASDSSVFAAKTTSSDNLCRDGGFRYNPIRIVGVDIPMRSRNL